MEVDEGGGGLREDEGGKGEGAVGLEALTSILDLERGGWSWPLVGTASCEDSRKR